MFALFIGIGMKTDRMNGWSFLVMTVLIVVIVALTFVNF